jgi:hypothetical protein
VHWQARNSDRKGTGKVFPPVQKALKRIASGCGWGRGHCLLCYCSVLFYFLVGWGYWWTDQRPSCSVDKVKEIALRIESGKWKCLTLNANLYNE